MHMSAGNRLRRGIAAGVATAASMGLASSAPTPRQDGAGEGCPVIDTTANVRIYSNPETQRAANFGAWMLGFMSTKCKHRAPGESFRIVDAGDGQLHMSLTRNVSTNVEGATAGSYHLSIGARKSPNGVNANDITSFTVVETATSANGGVTPMVDLTGTKQGESWFIYGDMRTHPRAGGLAEIRTGDNSTNANTARVLGVAAMVAMNEHAGAATNFVPVG